MKAFYEKYKYIIWLFGGFAAFSLLMTVVWYGADYFPVNE